MKLTTIIASATTAAVLGTVGISVAGAAGGGGSSPKPAATAAATSTAGAQGALRQNAKEGLALAAKTIGISTEDLRAGIKGGKSIAQIATDNHKNPQDVIDALVAAADKKIDASKLSAERKTKLEAKVPDAITKLVNSTNPRAALRHGLKNELRKKFGKDAGKLVAQTIGITAKELRTEVKAGKTIAQVATDHNKNPQDVINALVAAIDKKIDASKLSADRKTALEAKVPDKVADFVNDWRPKNS